MSGFPKGGAPTVQSAGVAVGTEQILDFVAGSNVTYTIVDDPANGRVVITTAATGGGGGSVATDTIWTAKGQLVGATGNAAAAVLSPGADFADELIWDSSAANGLRAGMRRNACRPRAALYETAPRNTQLNGTRTLASQTLALVGIDLPNGLTIASISFASAGQALVTGAHQFFGLYDDDLGSSSGTALALLRGTSDDTNTAWGVNTVKTLSLTSTYTTTRSGFFYLGILVDAATPPTLIAFTMSAGLNNVSPVLSGNSSTGQTSLPNPAAAVTGATAAIYGWVN